MISLPYIPDDGGVLNRSTPFEFSSNANRFVAFHYLLTVQPAVVETFGNCREMEEAQLTLLSVAPSVALPRILAHTIEMQSSQCAPAFL